MMEANKDDHLERDFDIASECGYSSGKPLKEITEKIKKARIPRFAEKEKFPFPVDSVTMLEVRERNRRRGR